MSKKKAFFLFFKILIRAFVILLTLVFLGTVLLFWRLSLKPLDLEFLMPEIQSYVLPAESGLKLEADSVMLSAHFSRRGLFHVFIRNMSLLGADESLILDLPDVRLSYGLRNIFTLNYMPLTAYVSDMLLQLTLTKEGRLLLQGQEGRKAVPIARVKQVGSRQQVVYGGRTLRRFMALRHIIVERAGIIIADELNGRRIMIPQLNALLERQRFMRYWLRFQTGLLMQKDLMRLEGESLISLGSGTAVFEASFDRVNLERAEQFAELMSGVKLVVSGTLKGELKLQSPDIRQWQNLFKSLEFTVKTVKEGTVALPAPLNTVYSLAYLNAAGVFDENLSALHIRPVTAALTNKLKAGVEIDVKNLKSFWNTFDFSAVQTELKAQISDIPIKLLPDVWPAVLGPDARVWVQKNLRDGTAQKALFTLKFTGARLADLTGDVDFKDMTVDYLSPMAPVTNAFGKVMLYPDRVEIFANGGNAGGIQLQDGSVYLTELDEPRSNAKVVLSVSGPAPEILALINEKPLELLSGYEIQPENTGGAVSGKVNLYFPLTESLKTNEVQVDITASVSDGAFETKDKSFKLTQAALGAVIDNKELTVKGTADYQGMPLDVAWTEYFTPTEKQPALRRFEAAGQTNDLFFKPYYAGISDYFIGSVKGGVVYEQKLNGQTVRIKGDLTDAELMLYPLAYTKFKGIPAALEAAVSLNKERKVQSVGFSLTDGTRTLDVAGELTLNGGKTQLRLDRAKAPGSDFSGDASYTAGQELSVKLRGKSWQINELKNIPYLKERAADTRPKPAGSVLPLLYFDVALDSLNLNPAAPLKQVAVKARRSGGVWNEFFISAKGNQAFSVRLTPDGKNVTGFAYDTGDILNRLNLTDDFTGGRASLKALQNTEGVLQGEITVNDMDLKDPGFVMQALSIIGIIDAFRGKELHFSQASVPFKLTPDFMLFITDGALYGASLGITFEGLLKQGYMDIKGSVIPAYALNSLPGKIPLIGGLFRGSAHGGLVGAGYSIKGEPSTAKIDFNPLSSIAPGILSRLFQ